MRREGIIDNDKRVYRIYRTERLRVPQLRRPKQRVSRGAEPAATPHERWSLDFVHGRLTNSRPLRLLTVRDDYTPECLLIEANTSHSGSPVTRCWTSSPKLRGRTRSRLTDRGPEFPDQAWSARRTIARHPALHHSGQTVAERPHRELQLLQTGHQTYAPVVSF